VLSLHLYKLLRGLDASLTLATPHLSWGACGLSACMCAMRAKFQVH
jgi:uncharacterized protein (DUF779 family)